MATKVRGILPLFDPNVARWLEETEQYSAGERRNRILVVPDAWSHWQMTAQLAGSDETPWKQVARIRLEESCDPVEAAIFIVQQCHGGDLRDAYWAWRHKESSVRRPSDRNEFEVQQESEIARFRAGVPQAMFLANLYVQGLMSVSAGADGISTIIDIQENGIDWTHLLASAPLISAVLPKSVIRIGDASLEVTAELAEKIGALPQAAIERIGKRLGNAQNATEARRILEEEIGVVRNARSGGIIRGANKSRVTFHGMEVRAVRDLSHVDDSTLRAMSQKGFAGKDINGEPLVLHHLGQNPAGPVVEMPSFRHNLHNTVQHPFGNTPGAGLTKEQRVAFDAWREDYWRARAQEELQRRGLSP